MIASHFHSQTPSKHTVKWEAIRAILTGISLTAINLFSGTFAMINYTASIFKQSGSTIDEHMSAIIVAAIQILGVYGSTSLVDRVGRKTLLMFSTSGAFVGLLALGTYSYFNEIGYDLVQYSWVPLASFSMFIFVSCFGILPLPFIVLTEILPAEVRRNLFCHFFCWFLGKNKIFRVETFFTLKLLSKEIYFVIFFRKIHISRRKYLFFV